MPPDRRVKRTAHVASASVGRCTALKPQPAGLRTDQACAAWLGKSAHSGVADSIAEFVPRRHLAANFLVLASNARPRMALGFDLDLAA